jgi:hypothetical protein
MKRTWLWRMLFGPAPKRARRDTAKVRNEAYREHLRREVAKNQDASACFIEVARKTVRM